MSEVDGYVAARKKFREYYDFLVKFNQVALKQTVEPRRGWANALLFRLTITATSMLTLTAVDDEPANARIEEVVVDHPSLAAVGRMVVEVAILFGYISDLRIEKDEWELRMHILELHDITARGRIAGHLDDMKLGDEPDAPEDEKRQRRKERLRKLISEAPQFRALDAKRQKKVLEGAEVFMKGIRAAVRETGEDVNHFDAIWVLTSNFAHAHPASFARSEALFIEQAAATLEFKNQLVQMDVVFDYCAGWLKFVVERTFLLYPELFLKGEKKH